MNESVPSLDAGSTIGLLRETSAVLAGGSDLDSVLDGCVRSVVRWVGAAFARIWLLSDDGRTLVLRASAGRYTHLDGLHGRIPVGAFKIGAIAASRQPYVTNDVVNDPLVNDPEWAVREGMVGFAGHPLISGGEMVGVMG